MNETSSVIQENKVLFIIIILVGIAILLFVCYRLYNNYVQFTEDNVYLVRGTVQGSSSPVTIPSTQIPRASDGPYGYEFSYGMWLMVNQDSYSVLNRTVKKHILHKGNTNMVPYMCPGIFLSEAKNDLEVHFTTYDYTNEVCKIQNVPIGKWFHLAVVVINKSIDVYINGNLKKRCTLKGLPIQNYGDVYIAKDIYSGDEQTYVHLSGLLSNVRYFNYALPYYRLEQLMSETPGEAPPMDQGIMPPYFSQNYYLQTGFPNVTPNK